MKLTSSKRFSKFNNLYGFLLFNAVISFVLTYKFFNLYNLLPTFAESYFDFVEYYSSTRLVNRGFYLGLPISIAIIPLIIFGQKIPKLILKRINYILFVLNIMMFILLISNLSI